LGIFDWGFRIADLGLKGEQVTNDILFEEQ
jgi:hypothetical protein